MAWAFSNQLIIEEIWLSIQYDRIFVFLTAMLESIPSKITILEWILILRSIQEIVFVHLLSLYNSNTTCFSVTRSKIDFYLFSTAYTHYLGNCCEWYCHCPDLSSLTQQNIKTDYADDKKSFILENWYSNKIMNVQIILVNI